MYLPGDSIPGGDASGSYLGALVKQPFSGGDVAKACLVKQVDAYIA